MYFLIRPMGFWVRRCPVLSGAALSNSIESQPISFLVAFHTKTGCHVQKSPPLPVIPAVILQTITRSACGVKERTPAIRFGFVALNIKTGPFELASAISRSVWLRGLSHSTARTPYGGSWIMASNFFPS